MPARIAQVAGGIPAEEVILRAPSAVAYGIAAGLAGLLLPVLFSPQVLSPFFTPKYVLLLLVGGIGFVPLVRLARSSRIAWPARAALAFLLVGLVSALLSPAVNLGFFGLDDWGTGWLFWLGCAGAFALGARLSEHELDWLLAGIVGGAVVNALVAIFQIVKEPLGVLAPYERTQADGLFGNPIHLEALLLGALALIARRCCVSGARRAWWAVAMLFSVALEFTSERFALPVLFVIVVVVLVVYGLRRAAPFVVAVLGGYGIGFISAGSGLGARVTAGTSSTTFGARLEFWRIAARSVLHHPFVGIGPGQVGAALIPHLSLSFAHDLPVDSHDVLVEVLATTGVLGFLAFISWIGGAAAKSQGPFLACAMAMLVVELVEPLNVAVTPVALLALGAATVAVAGRPTGVAAVRAWRPGSVATAPIVGRVDPSSTGAAPDASQAPATVDASAAGVNAPAEDGDTSKGATPKGARAVGAARPRRTSGPFVTALLSATALFVGVTMALGDHYLLENSNDLQPASKIAAGLQANRYLPYWPDAPSAIAQAYVLRSVLSTTVSVEPALAWELLAARRSPADPVLPSEAGTVELQLGDLSAARIQFLQSVKLDPWTYDSLAALGTIAKDEHQWSESISWYRRALVLAPSPVEMEHLIAVDEAHLRSAG